MHFAKQAAAKNLIDGWKCVEQCQAYVLMSLYSMPARKWEDDRSWMYLGTLVMVKFEWHEVRLTGLMILRSGHSNSHGSEFASPDCKEV
jgi:hypothetical protein